MSEVMLGLKGLSSILLTAVCSFFWMCGGRSITALKDVYLDLWGWSWANRFWGRIFAPTVYGLGIMALGWGRLTQVWAWAGFLALVYVGATLPHKTPLKRVFKAILWCSAGVFLCIDGGRWWLLALQMVSGISAQMLWGTKNPTPAPLEELGIYFAMSWITPFMVL